MVDVAKVKEIREQTKLSLNECKKALEKAGSVEDAIILLQGVQKQKANKRQNKEATEGRIHAYVHTGGQIASIVEVNCETDFSAKTEEFIQFCENIALQVVSMHPVYISRDEISKEQEEAQRLVLKSKLSDFLNTQKSEIQESIIDERINNWYKEVVLLEQTAIVDQKNTIADLVSQLSAQIGEKVVIARFDRWAIH